MTAARRTVTVNVLAACLGMALPAAAQVSQPSVWTLASSSGLNTSTFTVNAGAPITPGAGSDRVVVVAAVLESNNAGTVSGFDATLGVVGLTPLVSTETLPGRETIKLWYLLEAQIPAGAQQLVVSGTHTANVTSLHVYWTAFAGVFQGAPFVSSNASFAADASVAFGAPISYVAGGRTFYVAGNGANNATHTPLAGFTQQQLTRSDGSTSAAQVTGVQASAGTYAAGTTVAFSGNTQRSTVAVAALQPAAADLAVTKTASPTSIWVGDTVSFSIAVENAGPVDATSVTLTDTLPAGLALVSATPSQGTCSGTNTITCSLGGLANGASASVAVVATGIAPGSQVNVATVTAPEDLDSSNDSGSAFVFVTDQTRNADVAIAKSGTPASVGVGGTVTYTLTVTNNGPASADDVRVTDPIPAGMTLVSAAPSQGSCAGALLVTCTLGYLAPGGSATITIVVTNDSPGRKANTATVRNLNGTEYDPEPRNDNATATTAVTGGAAPLCVQPGKDGPGGNLAGVVNTYYPGTANVAAGSANTCIPVGVRRTGGGPDIAANDLLLVIQMQDATIDTSNTVDYGDGPGGADGAGALTVNAGKYEFVRATGARGACTVGGQPGLPVQGSGANGGLLNPYTNVDATTTKGQERYQVVRVPQYTTGTLTGASALPWLTTRVAPIGPGTGGILAIDVQGTLAVNAGVAGTVDGAGFRGAAGRRLLGSFAVGADYRSLSTVTTHGGKGEGVAGTPRWIYDPAGSHTCGAAIGNPPDYFIDTQQPNDGYPQGSMARGAPANAGGGSTDGRAGANDQNSGGGGGSNGGAGGHGGYSWNTVLDFGGRGAAVTPALSKLVLGGGGGAGTRNNDDCGTNGATAAQEGQSSSGAAGGGLMVIRAGQVVATSGGFLSANGADAYNETLNDGGGGGGAGGSVIVAVTSGDLAGLTVRARGGQGGSSWRLFAPGTAGEFTTGPANNRHGPGGGGGGGVIAYTNTPVPPLLDVTGGAPGISTTANSRFGAEPGGLGQTLLAAPGLIPGAGAGSDCSPDLAISLTHSETTVGPGGSATFVATVSNAGPFVSSSGLVTVTITLDPGLRPTAASGTGWTCSVAGQTATCTRSDALAPELSFPPIGVTATVLASGPVTLFDNVATVSNAGDVNTANNQATDAVGVRAPTLAHVRQFVAVRTPGGVRLLWRTTYEVNNLGFRVYRESGGVRTLVTPSLVAGSALLAGQQVPLSSGRSYSWLDDSGEPGAVYWLEDVDLDGTHSWTGPATPGSVADRRLAAAAAGAERSPLLRGLGRGRDDRRRPGPGMGHARFGHARRRDEGRVAPLAVQQAIAESARAARLSVPREGWYRLAVDELRAAGFQPGSDPRTLQLFVDGEEQALRVDDGDDGTLYGGDTVEFYGLGIDSPFDAQRAYWLVDRGERGLRVGTVRPLPARASAGTSFPFTVERRDRTVTFFSLTTNGDAENIFGDAVTAEPLSLGIDVVRLERTPLWNASLTVALQGVTLGAAHDVSVRLNGFDVGSLGFNGQERAEKTFSVPHEWLREGANELVLVASGPGEDVSLVDYVRLTYAHAYALDGGALRFTAPAGTQVALRDVPGAGLRVVDVTDESRPVELRVELETVAGATTAIVAVPGRGTAALYAFLPENAALPAAIVPNRPSQWHRRTHQADLVVIAHPSLIEAMRPLVARRQSQGLATALVDVTDVYDEYSFGQRTPYALRAFLADASMRWRGGPRYVLLAGDASFDPKNHLGLGDWDMVPTKLVPTRYLKTDSDDWLVDFDQDGLPELSIGRLPARTPDEASLIVAKILARDSALSGEATAPEWARRVLLVSDAPDEFDYEAASAALRASVPAGLAVQEISVAASGGAAVTQVVAAIDAGALLVNYTGHGSVESWTKHASFTGGHVAGLANGSALPFVVSMTCLNGMFDDLWSDSLAETFLKAPNGGAAAAWASSALTEPEPQSLLNQALFRQLFARPRVRIGDAVREAKAGVSDGDVRRSWILFGDPTMTLR